MTLPRLAVLATTTLLSAEEIEKATSPRTLIEAVADGVLRDIPEPPPFDWGEGVLMAGMMRSWEVTGEEKYLRFVQRFADTWADRRIEPLLREKGYCGRWGPGLALLFLRQATHESRYGAQYETIVGYILHEAGRTSEGALDHFKGKPQLWADTLYMSCPLLAEAAFVQREPALQAEAARQLELFAAHLRDPGSGLFRHMWDEETGISTSPFWARGNGWVVMTYADVLRRETDPARKSSLSSAFTKLLQGVVTLQDPETGLWHTVLDTPETYLETSASAMFLYGLAVNHRLKLASEVDPGVMRKAWAGIAGKVDSQGRVQGVSAGTTPGDQQRYAKVPVGVFTWGTGAFLLAACAYEESGLPNEPLNTIQARDGSEMVLVPGGAFHMGSVEGNPDEKPPRVLEVASFYIDKYEITFQQYAAFLQDSGRKPPVTWPDGKMPAKLAHHPVVNVTFADAQAYAAWTGKRLPTEAEWEKAARGTDGRMYPWGNSAAGKKAATPLEDNSKAHTWPVGSFADDVSPYGIMDMAGNAYEWTDSWYNAYPGNDQVEIEFGKKYRVIRGGGAIEYYSVPPTQRCAARGRSLPYGSFDALGFRCVVTASGAGQTAMRQASSETNGGVR